MWILRCDWPAAEVLVGKICRQGRFLEPRSGVGIQPRVSEAEPWVTSPEDASPGGAQEHGANMNGKPPSTRDWPVAHGQTLIASVLLDETDHGVSHIPALTACRSRSTSRTGSLSRVILRPMPSELDELKKKVVKSLLDAGSWQTVEDELQEWSTTLNTLAEWISAKDNWSMENIAEAKKALHGIDSEYLSGLERADPTVFLQRYPDNIMIRGILSDSSAQANLPEKALGALPSYGLKVTVCLSCGQQLEEKTTQCSSCDKDRASSP
jgi:hypothetical protein